MTATPRTLKATWTIEAAQDLTSRLPGITLREKFNRVFGIDKGVLSIEQEIASNLSKQICKEIDDEILKDLIGSYP